MLDLRVVQALRIVGCWVGRQTKGDGIDMAVLADQPLPPTEAGSGGDDMLADGLPKPRRYWAIAAILTTLRVRMDFPD